MLKKRIIPCLDVKSGRVVKGISFKGLRDAGNPAELATLYMHEGADELVFLDISASNERRSTMLQWVREVADNLFIPFTVGGGISSAQQARDLISMGADKISLNTAATENPSLITECSRILGRQAIVLAVDAAQTSPGIWTVFKKGGTVSTGMNVIEWVKTAENLGCGEILLTSIDQDGKRNGYDLELLELAGQNISVPIIASGGAGDYVHFKDCLSGRSDAALAASVFHFGQIRIAKLKRFLSKERIPVRIEGEC